MWGEGRFRSEFPRPKARLRKALPAEKHFNLSLRLARLPVAPQAGAAATAYNTVALTPDHTCSAHGGINDSLNPNDGAPVPGQIRDRVRACGDA